MSGKPTDMAGKKRSNTRERRAHEKKIKALVFPATQTFACNGLEYMKCM
jgi:hypothetical protein